jgi:hypothetical protein
MEIDFQTLRRGDIIELHPVEVTIVDHSDNTIQFNAGSLGVDWVPFDLVKSVLPREKTLDELRAELVLVKDELHAAQYLIETLEEELKEVKGNR